jgi:hypothetical protein
VRKFCDVGDVYRFGPDQPVAESRCAEPPTHRYRRHGAVEGHWSYRCARHVWWLDTSITPEALDAGGPATSTLLAPY